VQVPVVFIQCKGPEARTAASFSISRQREAADSLDEEPSSSSSSSSSSNGSRRSSSNGGSSGGSGGYSYFNEAEAAVVVDCLRQLLAAGMQPQDVCVITPYSGQVRSIQRLLSSDSTRPGERVFDPAVASMVEVKSVDGFQGREKEVVIFSAVRSNSSGRVGFLADSRRLNVALTRAKRGLVVVGDAATLRSDRVWSAWLAWAKKLGAIAASAESL
jgi:regulator of nonsense transcripts 1